MNKKIGPAACIPQQSNEIKMETHVVRHVLQEINFRMNCTVKQETPCFWKLKYSM